MKPDPKDEMMPYIIRYYRAEILIIVLFLCSFLPFVLRYAFTVKANEKSSPKTTATQTVDNSTKNNNQTITSVNIQHSSLSMPILMYHHIKPESTDGLTVSVDKFREQLDYIKQQGYEAITFSDLNENKIPSKPIILTFDDGYDNFYGNVFPLLKERGMTGVSYIITDKIGKSGYMSESQIKEISSAGIEIGSHTTSHPDLTSLSKSSLGSELSQSKKALENLTGKKIVSLCYPAGRYNDTVETVVKDSGYSYGIAIHNKEATFDDNYSLERYRVTNDSHLSAYLK